MASILPPSGIPSRAQHGRLRDSLNWSGINVFGSLKIPHTGGHGNRRINHVTADVGKANRNTRTREVLILGYYPSANYSHEPSD